MRPLIGIPPCLDARGRWRSGRDYHYIDAAYARVVAEAGGLPVYAAGFGGAAELAARLDGLLVPGGDDFPPDRPYPAGVRFDPAPERQRAADRALLAAVLARGLPVLGICYGMQLLALQTGGSLHYDLPSDRPEAAPHRLDPEERHAIEVEPGSLLEELLGRRRLRVNSRHHQAVADPGEARTVARAPDGVCEAIELTGAGFVLGVQWHPETLEAPHRERLFGGFVAACRAGAGGRGGGPA